MSGDALERVLSSLPAPHPPPPVAALWRRIDGSGERRAAPAAAASSRRRLLLRVGVAGAGAGALAAALWVALGVGRGLGARDDAPPRDRVAAEVAGLTEPFASVVIGEEVVAGAGPAAVRFHGATPAEDVTAHLEAGTRLRRTSASTVALARGVAGFEVPHGKPGGFAVEAAGERFLVRGTRFVVVVGGGATTSLSVEEGTVEVARADADEPGPDAVEVEAGFGWDAMRRRPVALPPPSLAMEFVERARAGSPVRVALVLSNLSPFALPRPSRDAVREPIFVEVVDPSGAPRTVRVTAEMVEADTTSTGPVGAPRALFLPPVGVAPVGDGASYSMPGRAALTLRFASTFPVPGTYRLRAVDRPTAGADRVVSPEFSLKVDP